MGWTVFYRHNSPMTYAEEKAEILNLFRASDSSPRVMEVLQASKVGAVWYLAVKATPRPGAVVTPDSCYVEDADGAYTFAAVILTSRKGGEWGYKDMCESVGPCETGAPVSLLAKLSDLHAPTGASYDPTACARRWREECRTRAATPKLKPGMRIRLAEPALFTFTGDRIGTYAREFEVTSYRRRGKDRRAFHALEMGGMLVRLTSRTLAPGFEVLAD